jgi:hypothetical protein
MTTRLGQKVMDLLQQGREEAVAEMAAANPRVLRPLMGRLYDPDPEIRRRAAGAMGRSAADHPKLGLDMVRRLIWSLNDEAATNGIYAVAALGEIGHRCPGLMEPFTAPLASMAWDDGLRPEILRALARIAAADPGLVEGLLDRLREHVDESVDEERAAFRHLVAMTEERNGSRD